jgi:thiol-disulfide isomerase/thioredoxin
MFHVKWCQHCEHMKPTFIEAGQQVDMTFLVIDCEETPEICKRNEIKSYPTFKYKLDDEMYDY